MKQAEPPAFSFLPGKDKLFFTTSSTADKPEPVSCTRIYQKQLSNTDLSSRLFNQPPRKPLGEMDKLNAPCLKAIYCSDLEGAFNLLRARHQFLHLVGIDTSQDWQYVERSRQDRWTYTCYSRGIMARNVFIHSSYDLRKVEDIQALAEIGLFDFQTRFSPRHGNSLCQWAVKNLYLDVALKLRPYTGNITTIADLYFALEDEQALCQFLQQEYLLDYINYPEYLLPKIMQKNWRNAWEIIKEQYKRRAHKARDDRLLTLLQAHFSTTEKVRFYIAHSISFLYAQLKANKSQYQLELLLLALFKKQRHSENQQWLIGLLLILSQQQQGLELVFKRYQNDIPTFAVPLSNFAFRHQAHELQRKLAEIDAYTPTCSQAQEPDTQPGQFSQQQVNEFIHACQYGDTENLCRFIKQGIDLDINKGEAMQLACKHSQNQCVKLLLEAGANPDPWASYTIKYANKNGNYELVKLLLDYGLEDKKFNADYS